VRRHEPDGIDFVFNGMSHQYFGPAMRVLRRGGMLVAFGAPKSFGDFLVLAAKLLGSYVIPNGKSIVGYGTHREGVDSFKEDWAKLFALLAEHRIEPIVEKVLPLDEAIDAYRILESGAVTGNLVLVSSSGSSEGVESEASGSTRE
jgi:NADPH:quinone reductase-like Zn-dependent oxidoreductase